MTATPSRPSANHAVRIHATGGPEVLRYEEVPEPAAPGPGEVTLRHTAIGLNYIDVYVRTGLYPAALPAVLGQEAAGVVEAVGPGVTTVAVGDRVAYCGGNGAYSLRRNHAAAQLVRLPDGISDETGAAMMLKGLTAEYLLRRTYAVQPGDAILVHAAAGGVGLLLCQWAHALGATVIGTVSTDEKAALARQNGCAHVILYRSEPVAARVRELTGGKGVRVVYDSVGKDTFEASLDSLMRRGLFVSFGNASGPVPPFSPLVLSQKGSLYFTRTTLFSYLADATELREAAGALFDVVTRGVVKVRIDQRFPLAEVAAAHRALESRSTTGSTVLLP